MKKAVVACVALALLAQMALVGCNQQVAGEMETIGIGVLIYDMEDPFISQFPDYIKRFAREAEAQNNLRITVTVMDAKGSQSLQDEQVQKLINQKCNVLCVNMVDRTAAAGVIDKAKAGDVPIVFFNREPVMEDMQRWEKLYYVCSLAAESGEIQGDIIAQAYFATPALWDRNGDGKLQYVILEGERGHQDSLIRTESTLATLMENGISTERLASQTASWRRAEAGEIVSGWLEAFGGEIEMVISNNDNMALGAIDAYRAAGRPVPIIVGVDAIAPALAAIRNGELVGTVLNDALGQSELIFQYAYELAMGRHPVDDPLQLENHYGWVPHSPVTADNVEKVEARLS